MRFLGWMLLGACNTESTPLPSTDKEGEPAISLEQDTVDFGTVSALSGETASVTLTIANDGDADLIIEDVWTDDEDVLIGQLYPPVVPPQETASLVLTYAPAQDTSTQSTLTIASSARELVVDVVGEGTAPRLERSAAVDFGAVAIGCTAEEVVTLTNAGREDLVIDELGLSASSGVSIEAADALPWTIAPGGSAQVPLLYAPYDAFADTLNLTVSSNDPAEPVSSVALEGLGEDQRVEDSFTIDTTPDADILFAIDKSCSMSDDIAKLVADFDDFISDLDAGDVDYRIAAIVQDDGSVSSSSPYIAPGDHDDIISMLTEMLGGSYGSSTEKAFTLLYNGMSTGSNRPGNWLRDDAALHLIGMSDEPEQSDAYSWDGYVSYFQGLKDHPDQVTFHGIGGDYPSGCSTASPYTGFYEATVATDGGFWSICDKAYATLLVDLAAHIVERGAGLRLSQEPAEETIVVEVSGAETDAWSLNDQSIVLDELYADETEVTVRYTPADTCP